MSAASPTAGNQGITRYVRFHHRDAVSYGILEGDGVRRLDGDPLTDPEPTGEEIAADEVQLLAPVVPSKIIAVGLNYRSHLGHLEPAGEPGLFAKLPSSVIGPEADIVIPAGSSGVHYEGELVVVIGRTAKGISEDAAADHVFGVTAGNDVSERHWQKNDLQWLRAKGADTFAPLGPAVVVGLDYQDLRLETRVNGEVRQAASTAELIFGIHRVVSYVSRYVTLSPGDLIYTGTPGKTRAMRPGDVVEVEIEGVGVLRNRVRAES